MPQAAQVQRAIHAENIGGIQFQLSGNKINHCGGHPSVHLQPHGIAKTPLPHCLLNGFEQIVRFQFFDRHFGVARQMEDVRSQDFEARKQMMQIRDDQLFQPDEAIGARAVSAPVLPPRAVAASYREPSGVRSARRHPPVRGSPPRYSS